MKAFSESNPRSRIWLASSFSWRRSWSRTPGPRRAQPDRYPDLGLDLAPAFPVLVGPVAVGVCSPLQWRNRPRFSRGSL